MRVRTAIFEWFKRPMGSLRFSCVDSLPTPAAAPESAGTGSTAWPIAARASRACITGPLRAFGARRRVSIELAHGRCIRGGGAAVGGLALRLTGPLLRLLALLRRRLLNRIPVAAPVVLLPAAILLSIDIPIAARIDVTATRPSHAAGSLRPPARDGLAAAAALCDAGRRACRPVGHS